MAYCISIVGSSASGKSSVGLLLADLLNFNLYDIDKIISKKTGKNIDKIFAEKGTEYFQKKNIEILEELFPKIQTTNSLLIIGASPIQNKYTRNLIKQWSSYIIGLYAEPEILIKRIFNSTFENKHAAHPLLIFDDDFMFSKLLFEFREPFLFFANEVIDTSNLSIQEVCNQVELFISVFTQKQLL